MAMKDIEVHLRAHQTMTEQFQWCEWGHCHLGKEHYCFKVMSESLVAPDYSACCPRTPLKGNNGTNRSNSIASQTVTEPLLCSS
jgi:hypothetical protein